MRGVLSDERFTQPASCFFDSQIHQGVALAEWNGALKSPGSRESLGEVDFNTLDPSPRNPWSSCFVD
jgi:hypothetical protein